MSSCLVSGLIVEFPFVLASGSPRRKRILDGLGLAFEIEVPGVDETALEGESPEGHVVRLSRDKAAAVARARAAGTVLAADTAVLLDGRLLGKPVDASDASFMLKSLRGRWHEVLTGVTLIRCSDGASVSGFERTSVEIRDLSDDEVQTYVSGGEPLDKAGSYGIQDCGSAVVSRVDGCFYNVVGLPVVRMCGLLRELNSISE